MSRLTPGGTTELILRDRILRRGRGQGKLIFLCSADHELDWQPYPVDPYSAESADHTYIRPRIISKTIPVLFQVCVNSSPDAIKYEFSPEVGKAFDTGPYQ